MNVAITVADIIDESKKVNIILTCIPTNSLDEVIALIVPKTQSSPTLADLTDALKQFFKPKSTIVKGLSEFQN